MTTEKKIREAFEKYASRFDTFGDKWQDMGADQYFIAGYLALLNELEFCGYNNTPQEMLMHKVYRLPEGIEK